jgi:hypothetical protein
LFVLINYLQVAAVTQMLNTSQSMRCFLKGTSNSTLVQFSGSSEDQNDTGDGGGIPVFAFWSISSHGMLVFAIFFFSPHLVSLY